MSPTVDKSIRSNQAQLLVPMLTYSTNQNEDLSIIQSEIALRSYKIAQIFWAFPNSMSLYLLARYQFTVLLSE